MSESLKFVPLPCFCMWLPLAFVSSHLHAFRGKLDIS